MARTISDKNGIRYLINEYIGKGSFSKVFVLQCSSTNKNFAGKFISKEKLIRNGILDNVWTEIKIHRMLRHHNIVRFFSYTERESHIVIILELCSKDSMVHVLQNLKTLRLGEAKFCMLQIVSAVEYLHTNRIVHRDLKLGNLFVHDGFQIKIGDFGLAVRIEYEGQKRFSRCGTPNYLAPEIINGVGHSYAVDIWALGCILYTMLEGTPPFQGKNVTCTYNNILSGKYSFSPRVDYLAKVFIMSCLNLDPNLRPDVYQVFRMEFLASTSIVPQQPSLGGECEVSVSTPTRNGQEGRAKRRRTSRDVVFVNDVPETKSTSSNFLHGCFLKLYNSLKDVEDWAESNFCEFLSEHSSIVPLTWVNAWVDYCNFCGFAYQLNNKNAGVIFNDETRMLLEIEKEIFHYVQSDGSTLVFKKDSVPEELSKKTKIVLGLGNYMKGSLLKAHEGLFLSSPNQRNVSPTEVFRWGRSDEEVAMFLSNGSVQLNFLEDHTKLIFCGNTRTVTIIESPVFMKTLKLDSLRKCGCSKQLKKKIQLALQYVVLALEE